MDEWKQTQMTEREYKQRVSEHTLYHLLKGDFFTPSDDNCELAYCACQLGINYRLRLEVLKRA